MKKTGDRQAFMAYLERKGCANGAAATAVLEPLFQNAEAGVYPLAPATEINLETLKAAIATATGKTAADIVFVSWSAPYPKPEWLSAGGYRGSLDTILERHANIESLGVILGGVYDCSLEAKLPKNEQSMLLFGVTEDFENQLQLSLCSGCRSAIGLALNNSLMFYLGFCLVNDEEQAAKLKPLAALLASCIVLGEFRGRPNTWLVLCA